jgi:hypothetical protein
MSSNAFAVVIVQNLGGTATSGVAFQGQSFTTPSGGPWDDITFNFFSDVPPTTPEAAGSAFLLSQQYSGTVANLSSSAPGFLGESTGITGGKYVFPTSLVLDPNVQYWVYENAAFSVTGGNTITGGQGYFAQNASFGFNPGTGVSNNFTVSGDVASTVPEPSTWAMILAGFVGLGFAAFRRSTKGGRVAA